LAIVCCLGHSLGQAPTSAKSETDWIHFVTPRRDTIDLLDAFNVPYNHLRMRAAGDFTADEELKRQWIQEYKLEDIICVFDDRTKVVNMWRDLGLTCFQVAPGDF